MVPRDMYFWMPLVGGFLPIQWYHCSQEGPMGHLKKLQKELISSQVSQNFNAQDYAIDSFFGIKYLLDICKIDAYHDPCLRFLPK